MFKKVFVLFIFTIFVSMAYGQYPASWGIDNSSDWITQVTFDNINSLTNTEPGGYGDYTSEIANLIPGSTYDLTVSVQSSMVYLTAWIDWNQDDDFTDIDEEYFIVAGATSAGSFTTTINVPLNLITSPTRMRISLSRESSPLSFGAISYGEVEDYGIIVADSCGIWQICLTDDNPSGNGWNGADVSVFVNGIIVLDGISLTGSIGPECHTFEVNVGDIVSCDYTAGSFATDNEYYILNQNSVIVQLEGVNGTVPGDMTGLEACPDCSEPSSLIVLNSNITSADLSWTESGTATVWDIELLPSGSTPTGNPTVSGITSNPYVYTGLVPNTSYDWYVRSDCYGSSSIWVGPGNFNTPINGVQGDVSGTWISANSPYGVIGDITVQASECLTIEAGVEVIFYDSYKLDIFGCINAVGTEDNIILFTADDPGIGWLGINFYNTISESSSLLKYCTIEDGDKTVINEAGGGIYTENCGTNLNIEYSIIKNNSAEIGGGIYLSNNSNPTIIYSKITGNMSAMSGGGLSLSQSSPIISNTIIAQNNASENGGGISFSLNSNAVLNNVTINENSAGIYGGGIYSTDCFAPNNSIITSCIVWGNVPETTEIYLESGEIEVNYSNVYLIGGGLYPGTDNINYDPNFLDTIDHRLSMTDPSGTSMNPLVDAGDPAADFSLEPLPNGSRINIGAWGGSQYAAHSAIVDPIVQPVGTTILDDPVVYIFNNPPEIINGATLQINSGAEVAINFEDFWDCYGILDIVDTGGEPVVITTLENFNSGNEVTTWAGLKFYPNTMRTPSQLDNVQIVNALNGIETNSSELIMNNSSIIYEDGTGFGSYGVGLYSNASPLELNNCNIIGYNSGVMVQNINQQENIIVDFTNTTISSEFEVNQLTSGIYLFGYIDSDIDNCDIEDFPFGIIYQSLGRLNTRDTPTLTNSRVRSSAQSSRTEMFIGIMVTEYSGLDIYNCDIEHYQIGIVYDNTSSQDLSTPTLTNTRVRNSPESTREGTHGIQISGYVSIAIDDCDIDDYIDGIYYIGTGQAFPTGSTPTLTNTRVRNSAQSTRTGDLGLSVTDINSILVDLCDVDGYAIGIEVNNEESTSFSTPTLTNTRVRNSPESTRYGSKGISLNGYVAAYIDECDVEDYTEGISFAGSGQSFPVGSTPTITNTRVRNSPQSTRINEKGIMIVDIKDIYVDSCLIEDFETGIEVANETAGAHTPTLTNTRVRNSPESTRTNSVGLKLIGDLNASVFGFEFIDCNSAIIMQDLITSEIAENLIYDTDETMDDIGIYTYFCDDVVLRNNTIYGFHTGLSAQYSEVYSFSNIIWESVVSILETQSTVTSEYNDIEGGYSTLDINEDPEFIDPTEDDFNLEWFSPCIDAGNPNPNYYDPDGTISDIGVSYYHQTSSLSTPVLSLVSIESDEVLLEWDHTEGTISYKIYSSDNPNSGFSEDTNGEFDEASWTVPATNAKRFYYVVGVNNVTTRIRRRNSQ